MALQEELKSQGDFLFKYRSYLPFGLLLAGLIFMVYNAQNISAADETWLMGALKDTAIFIGLLGLLVRVLTIGYTPKNTSGRNTSEGQIADSLNTKGMYAILRNPLYLGNYLMWLAISMLTGNIAFILIFTLIFWIYYERIVFSEEVFLRQKFGQTYLDWAAKTPPFIPRVFNWKAPNLSFSWKKVLRKERNGLFALFLVFFLFKTIAKYATDHTWIIEDTWLIYGVMITGAMLLILKIIGKTTDYLNEEGR